MLLAPSHSDLGESLLRTTLLEISLGEPDGKTPTGYECEQFSQNLFDILWAIRRDENGPDTNGYIQI